MEICLCSNTQNIRYFFSTRGLPSFSFSSFEKFMLPMTVYLVLHKRRLCLKIAVFLLLPISVEQIMEYVVAGLKVGLNGEN